MEVGLFFGSFNPIHTGHLIIASLVKETTDVEEVWFVVSPQNPFKKNKSLLHEFDRLDMVNVAIGDDYKFRSSDIEFNMPRPSYTIDTLTLLQEKHLDKRFHLIIGQDNLEAFPKWKNHDKILEHFGLIVYPRPHSKSSKLSKSEHVKMIEAPEVDISATLIRKLIKEGRSIKYLVPESVESLIKTKGYYL
ncbi:nicotinate (nicotinamide) nucleotide adenylyltransferase [Ekhidna sp.]|uniref:nicotinate (nicotinamide) nucleotide adenylyltransferase n=1 Tax=Ekhidna sp. TaxID=2608089 RepID=UPI003298F0D0